jgi:hypothetical protein
MISMHTLFVGFINDVDPTPITLRSAFPHIGGTVSLREAHAVLFGGTGLPETVASGELFPIYLTENLRTLIQEIERNLKVGPEVPSSSGNAFARFTSESRKTLQKFLNETVKHAEISTNIDLAYKALLENEDPDEALSKLTKLPAIGEFAFDRALATQDTEFNSGSSTLKIPGYKGEPASADERRELMIFMGLCGQGSEFHFRRDLLLAERHLRKREYSEAISAYKQLEKELPETDVVGRSLLAVRQANAHFELGNKLYCDADDATTNSLAPAKAQYDLAEQLLTQIGFTPPKPEDDATGDPAIALFRNVLMQKEKVATHLNPLGLHDSMVPTGRPEFLLKLAKQEIESTKEAAKETENFLLLGNKEDDAIAALDFQIAEALNLLQKANTQKTIADDEVGLADNAFEAIEEQENNLENKKFGLTISTMMGAAVAIITENPIAGAQTVNGLVSGAIDLEAEGDQLRYQKKAAKIQKEIAASQASIAAIEAKIADARHKFLKERKDALKDDPLRLTRDVFYQLAELFDTLAREHFNKAHRLAYLYERAVSFRLGIVIDKKDKIRFNYLNSNSVQDHQGVDIFSAPFELFKNLQTIENKFGEIPSPDTFPKFKISLASRFPLEFQSLLQGKTMDFVISLYDLEKVLRGISNQRVGNVTIDLIASLPTSTNIAVKLTNQGVSLVRDHGTILDAKTTRLIPTPEDIDAALQNLTDGNIAGALVNGVRVVHQPRISKFLNPGEGRVVGSDLFEFALGPLEDYGIAGPWSIEVIGVNPKAIRDIHFVVDIDHSAATPEQSARIEELVEKYEEEIRSKDTLIAGEHLDKIVVFKMATTPRFQDQLDQLINQPLPSETSFRLNESDFIDFNPLDARVKGVILQVVREGDEEEVGVKDIATTFSKDDTNFSAAKKTLETGFTENLEEEIELLSSDKRFPILGRWRIRIDEGSPIERIKEIKDLRWFFILEIVDN